MLSKENKELLSLIAQNGAITAENSADMMLKEKPEADLAGVYSMRDSFLAIKDKIEADEPLTRLEWVHLWTGAQVTKAIHVKNIEKWSAVVFEYENNLIPKLFEISKAENHEELVDKYFSENLTT